MMRLVAVAGNKVVNSALDNLLISGSEIFIDFSIKRGVRKLPQSFFLVEVGPPNTGTPYTLSKYGHDALDICHP